MTAHIDLAGFLFADPEKNRKTWPTVTCLCLVLGSLAQSSAAQAPANDEPEANPARPTVATPATLTPVGYLQFESGILAAWNSPEFSSRTGTNEVVKLAVARRLQFAVSAEPMVWFRAGGARGHDPGDVFLGAQAVVVSGEAAKPTIAVSYFHQVRDGGLPDIDIGSAPDSVLFLASADVKGFHYDANAIFNRQREGRVSRAQVGQTISISHQLRGRLGLTGEL